MSSAEEDSQSEMSEHSEQEDAQNEGSGEDNEGSGEDNEGSGEDNEGSGEDIEGSGQDNEGSGEDNEDSGKNDDEPQEEKSGWADAMSKILGSNKPKKKKMLILSRAKKDYEVKKPEKPESTIEIVPSEENGTVDAKSQKIAEKKKASPDNEDDEGISPKKRRKLELQQKRVAKQWENLNRVKPNPAEDKETERELMKIATKGVVELFNAVNLQKKALSSKLRNAPRSEFKKDKIFAETKDLFEDALDKVKKKQR